MRAAAPLVATYHPLVVVLGITSHTLNMLKPDICSDSRLQTINAKVWCNVILLSCFNMWFQQHFMSFAG